MPSVRPWFAATLFVCAASAFSSPRVVTITPVRGGQPVPVESLAGCRIVVESEADANTQLLPCKPFVPQQRSGSKAWLESDQFISLAPWDLGRATETTHLSPIVAAGRVRVVAPKLDPALGIRLFQAPGAFSRFVSRTSPDVLMPAGKTVAVAFDARGRVVAVSNPVTVTASKTVDVELPLQGLSTLVVRASGNEPFELLRDGTTPPDLVIQEAALHVWYDAAGADTSVELRSERLSMPPLRTTLRRNALTFEEVELRRKPSITVRLDGADEVLRELRPLTVSVRAEGGDAVLRSAAIGGVEQTFEFVPPHLLRVVLEGGPVRLEQRADLTAGEDATIAFALDPIEVRGRVTRGGKAVRARVELRRGSEETRVETGDDGAYEARVWSEGKYFVEVQPPAGPSHVDVVDIGEDANTIDIDIPETSTGVRVVDADGGAPIERASVTLFNSWSGRDGQQRASRTVFTDGEGKVMLPPLRTGEVVVHVAAKGFRQGEPLRFAVTDSSASETRWFEIAMSRNATHSVQLRLSDGSPAAQAQLFAVARSGREWGATADANGMAPMPADFGAGVIVARHRSGHVAAAPWVSAAETRELLLPARGIPLVVRTTDAAGKPAPFVALTVWMHGVALTPAALAFLADGVTSSDASGVWTARAVPPVPLRIAAAPLDPNVAGAFATDVLPPWPAVVTVRAR